MKHVAPRELEQIEIDGVIYHRGDKLPLEKPKLKIYPAHWVDGPASSPRGVFRNGRGKA